MLEKGKPIFAWPIRAAHTRTTRAHAWPAGMASRSGPRGAWPMRANGPQRGSPRARRPTCKNTLTFSNNTTNTMCAISTDYDFAIKPSQTPSFTTAWSSATRARRRGGDGIGRLRRLAMTRAGSTNGPTPIYNPSAYTSLFYRSDGAHGSGDHGVRPCATVARPCRPPSAIVG